MQMNSQILPDRGIRHEAPQALNLEMQPETVIVSERETIFLNHSEQNQRSGAQGNPQQSPGCGPSVFSGVTCCLEVSKSLPKPKTVNDQVKFTVLSSQVLFTRT